MPAALKLLFGPANLAVNYGLLYTAVSCGSIVSGAITMLVSAKDAYFFQFTGCGCVCLLGKPFSWLLLSPWYIVALVKTALLLLDVHN
ncbi:uncharacterized protein DEA37_0005415 [Paragonimus westermani]|uniref:Uncharacterized protein n=1 Tax=Paragonimus westermani TaxID=34504 RepID=A0A5J4NMV8_9TREM|nr:uncharacterized protein DEA37_0005415 [Paragonimus westermani]